MSRPEIHLGDDVVVPDIAGWRRERMPVMLDVAYHTVAPDWVCEVLSPSTFKLDRGRKLAVYARERVTHVWFVDPARHALEVLRLDGDQYRVVDTAEADAVVRLQPFDAVELKLARLWKL